jgi:hypothetical protein
MDRFKDFNNLKEGDEVIITYKDCKWFLQTGKIVDIDRSYNIGDCKVSLDFMKGVVTIYKTNLVKIMTVIEKPSGEVMYLKKDVEVENLLMRNIIKYDRFGEYYFFNNEDRWEIELHEV